MPTQTIPPTESPEMAGYRASLRTFDWQFEFSDDADHIRKTRVQLAEMRRQQALLDPDGTIWTTIAPRGHGVPLPIVCAQRSAESDGTPTYGLLYVVSPSGTMIISDTRVSCIAEAYNEYAKANARRIAACWNACYGISTENLEQNIPIKELVNNYNTVIAHRNELLIALDMAVSGWERGDNISGPMQSGRAILNKFFDHLTKTGVLV